MWGGICGGKFPRNAKHACHRCMLRAIHPDPHICLIGVSVATVSFVLMLLILGLGVFCVTLLAMV